MAVDFQERFWRKVYKTSSCWLWRGASDKDGYGVFGLSASVKSVRAHRQSWEISFGPIPAGLLVLHRCDEPSCVNPSHLFLGTHADNMQDKVRKGRCLSGMTTHPECAARGEGHGNARLTEAQVLSIRARYVPRKVPLRVFAEEFSVPLSTVNYALKIGWKHVEVPRGC